MIIIRYLVLEAFKSQLLILLILLLIFFCQKLVKILTAIVDGVIPSNLVLSLLGLGVPGMLHLILPLSLFLSLLITFDKLHTEGEITVMHACGLSKVILVKVAMILALLTGIVLTVSVFWLGPFFSRRQDELLAEVKENHTIMPTPGHFQQVRDSNSVLFIKSVKDGRLNEVFFAQLRSKGNARPSVVIADSGQIIQCKDGSKVIILNKGTCFEGTAMLRDFRITNFQNYQAIIERQPILINPRNTEQMNMATLINSYTNCARAELHWRVTLIFSVFVMALMVVPLSVPKTRQDRVCAIPMFSATLLYLMFFLLEIVIKSNASKGKIDPIVWTWTINSFYLLLAVGLNLWDTVLVRSLRARFTHKGAT